jgi:hypothetical protein
MELCIHAHVLCVHLLYVYVYIYELSMSGLESTVMTGGMHTCTCFMCASIVCVCIYIYIYIYELSMSRLEFKAMDGGDRDTIRNTIYVYVVIYVCVYMFLYMYIYMSFSSELSMSGLEVKVMDGGTHTYAYVHVCIFCMCIYHLQLRAVHEWAGGEGHGWR